MNSGWWEQSALIEIIDNNELNIKDNIDYIDQRKFNSMMYNLYNLNYPNEEYKIGDFILHLPNVSNKKRIEIIKNIIK